MNLDWSAASDDVGVSGYLVERCTGEGCSDFRQIAGPSRTTYTDNSLVGNTGYSYRVKATDAAGNLSSYSDVAAALTAPFVRYVQSSYAAPQTPQTTVSVAFPAAQMTGDLNVIVVGWADSTAVVSAVM